MAYEYPPQPPQPPPVPPSPQLEFVPEKINRVLVAHGWSRHYYGGPAMFFYTHEDWPGYYSWSEAVTIINARAIFALGE